MGKLIIEPEGCRYSIYGHDDGGTRRELMLQLCRMNPGTRIAFLRSCVDEMNRIEYEDAAGVGVKSRIRNSSGMAEEVWNDVCYLLFRGLPIEWVMRAAERHRKHPQEDDPAKIRTSCVYQ